MVASLDPNCELVDLESQVSAARETEASLSAINWDDIIKQKNAVLGLVAHPLLQVVTLITVWHEMSSDNDYQLSLKMKILATESRVLRQAPTRFSLDWVM